MENLKIRVTTEQESKEAQELFFELGYKFSMVGFCEDYNSVQVFDDGSGSLFEDHDTCENKELTIQQLKDMVVLKRNDENDATHTDQDGWKWYIGADSYVWQAGNSQQLKQWDQISLAMVDLEPINKEISETEYLTQGENGKRLMESVEQLKGIDATLAERQATYGCFEDVARTTEQIMEALAKPRVNGLNELPYPHRMALYMIASKMARIVNGDFNHKDSWHDIGGYAKLVEDLID